ncbi:ArsR/SmtB family transcription factor [Athalassotoga saccharophila]|uniref:ArsR/SmtB family transcription factor n=1 Tax=Athalassotoga saccharophila TaxID=1441386 RepID=UPI001E4F167E|nr:metalloregulator ArsR/SmtB family transcription factor [Athalassotoga saccharophila]BBJ27423.1 HTH-type transcriptional repressor CzrA [Athalassotoga saccharophila]
MDKRNVGLMAKMGSLFANELRMEILIYLLDKGEACVGKIVEDLGLKQSTVSNQLKILKLGGAVKTRKEKNKIFYSLADSHISNLLIALSEHVKEGFYE